MAGERHNLTGDVSVRPAMLLRIARFAKRGLLPRRDLEAESGVNRSTVQRAVNRLRRLGEASFRVRPWGTKPDRCGYGTSSGFPVSGLTHRLVIQIPEFSRGCGKFER